MTLGLFAAAFTDPALAGWPGLGLAVQAYGKRAIPILRWLRRMSAHAGKQIPVRLVKGAYWDSEIKWAQERGLADYPVLTRKVHTDVSYLACMRLLLSDPAAFYPQFATHNAQSIAAVSITAPGTSAYEFQRLHGMGEALYEEVIGGQLRRRSAASMPPSGRTRTSSPTSCGACSRTAPTRRSSTGWPTRKRPSPTSSRTPSPPSRRRRRRTRACRLLPRPQEIFAPDRINSRGMALDQPTVRATAASPRSTPSSKPSSPQRRWSDGKTMAGGGTPQPVLSPHDRRQRVGTVSFADAAPSRRRSRARAGRRMPGTGSAGRPAPPSSSAPPTSTRRNRVRLMAVMVREAGKTLENALSDVREAIDFLRYYAMEARRLFSGPVSLKGPTGETNLLELRGRGPVRLHLARGTSRWRSSRARWRRRWRPAIRCWPSPPSRRPSSPSSRPSCCTRPACRRPCSACCPGDGKVGAALVKDPRVAGVAFTGSNDAAWAIQSALAERRGAIVPFIAETGGLNAMIADFERAARAGDPRRGALGLRLRRASAARPRASSSCRRRWRSR